MKFVGSTSGKSVPGGAPGGRKMRNYNLSEANITLSSIMRDVVTIPGVTSVVQNQDIDETYETTATGYTEYDIVAELSFYGSSPTFSSSDTGVMTVSSNGIVTRVSDGTAWITASNDFAKSAIELTIVTTGGDYFLDSTVRRAGTLSKECEDAVMNRINGLTASDTTKDIHNGSVYNASCWAADIDLTAINLAKPTATAITPRHCIAAEHYPPGTTIEFIGSDNVKVTRTRAARKNVGPSNASDSYATDLQVITLDSDLPATVTPVKVMPSNILDYLPTLTGFPVAALCLDQEKKALVTDLYNMTTTRASFTVPSDADRLSFYESKISGDSGSPAFLIINGEIVLITTWTFGGAGSGPPVYNLNSDINTAIAAADALAGVSTGYTVSTPDLSGFTSFP